MLDDTGMVRIASEPPGRVPQSQICFEDRCVDVPAARVTNRAVQDNTDGVVRDSSEDCEIPLVVPLGLGYSPSGNGVVSTRTAQHVGFNGIEFRGLNACPELRTPRSPLSDRRGRGDYWKCALKVRDRMNQFQRRKASSVLPSIG